MKTITRERLINTLLRIQKVRSKKMSADIDIMSVFATHGIKATFGQITERDRDEMKLELAYIEKYPKSMDEFQVLRDRVMFNNNHYLAKTKRVTRIQAKYNISGLGMGKTKLGGFTILHPEEDDLLVLIESDLEILRQKKQWMFSQWRTYITANELTSYRYTEEGWEVFSIEMIEALLPFYDWVTFYEDVSYHSPKRMKKQGWDNLRSEPKYPDDIKHIQVHLSVGKGLNMEIPKSEDYMWFCASNLLPSM